MPFELHPKKTSRFSERVSWASSHMGEWELFSEKEMLMSRVSGQPCLGFEWVCKQEMENKLYFFESELGKEGTCVLPVFKVRKVLLSSFLFLTKYFPR